MNWSVFIIFFFGFINNYFGVILIIIFDVVFVWSVVYYYNF